MANHARTLKRFLDGRPDYSHLNLPPRPDKDGPPPRKSAVSRITARTIVLNLPLMIGLFIVVVLFFITLFGPLLAPENPYLVGTTSLTSVEGELQSPPFPPSTRQPLGSDQWGRDILSLLLYGTRNTLVATTFITMARVLLGTILGIIAGMNEGKSSDRLIMGTVGITTSIPLLLTGMILIFALDVRKGITVFLIALCVVGWGEIAQYIRGEFLVLRQRPFIEGARAMGLTGPSIAIRHILPNILPALIVITLLEMGATLMLLGELGFVGVFMGGGTQQENIFTVSATIPDIPEWGAMMADSRVWARGRPWMVFYPALAFFLAVLGFNALGEGLRQLIERAGINTAILMSKRMLAVVVIVVGATWYIVSNVGPAPSYARLAENFDGEAALSTAKEIVAQGSRGAGDAGHEAVADYIAARFAEYGLQPAGGGRSYFQKIDTRLVRPLSPPELVLVSQAGEEIERFLHQQDFGFRIEGHAGNGRAEAPITALAFSKGNWTYEMFAGLDLRDQVALVLDTNMPAEFVTEALIRGAQAVLIVEDRPLAVRSDVHLADGEADYVRQPTLPVLSISRGTAERILAFGGSSLEQLEKAIEAIRDRSASTPLWQSLAVGAQARVGVHLSEPEEVTLRNVLGFYPGQDVALNRELVVVSTHYDTLGAEPTPLALRDALQPTPLALRDASQPTLPADGTGQPSHEVTYSGADDSAAGIATLLEIARLWHEQGYTPRRTVLFAVFTGAELTKSGAAYYVEGYGGSVGSLNPVAGFNLTRLGAGGDALETNSSPTRVVELLERYANSLGVDVIRGDPMNHHYQETLRSNLPMIVVQRVDSGIDIREDTLDRLSADKLQEAGEAINLSLIVVSRDANW